MPARIVTGVTEKIAAQRRRGSSRTTQPATPVGGRVEHPRDLAAQHGGLVPQYQQLGVLAQIGIWICVGLLAAGSVVAVLTIHNTRVRWHVIASSHWCVSASLGSHRLRRRDRRTAPEGAWAAAWSWLEDYRFGCTREHPRPHATHR